MVVAVFGKNDKTRVCVAGGKDSRKKKDKSIGQSGMTDEAAEAVLDMMYDVQYLR